MLISISIVAEQVWLWFVGSGLGLIGALLMINGFTLLINVPWLG